MAIINWELFLPVALLLTGCVSDRSLSALPIRRLEKGSQSGVVEPRQVVIKDKASWERLWREHQSGDQPQRPAPEIDFAREIVIFVAMGQQSSGGFTIEIVNVEASQRGFRILFQRKGPPPDAMITQALTAPFEIVAIPKSDLRPEFVEIKAAGPQ